MTRGGRGAGLARGREKRGRRGEKKGEGEGRNPKNNSVYPPHGSQMGIFILY